MCLCLVTLQLHSWSLTPGGAVAVERCGCLSMNLREALWTQGVFVVLPSSFPSRGVICSDSLFSFDQL